MGMSWGEEARFGIPSAVDIGVCDIMRLKPFSLSERWRVHHTEIICLALYISASSIMDKIAVLEPTASSFCANILLPIASI